MSRLTNRANLPPTDRPARLLPAVRVWLQNAFDLVFPPVCTACGRVGESYCWRCIQRLNAEPLAIHRRKLPDGVTVASTGAHHDHLQGAVQALKYHSARAVADPLADRLAQMTRALKWQRAALIVPVPAHPARLAQRGYNQAELLAHALSIRANIPHAPHALTRTRDTRSQVGLSQGERLTNVQGAFAATPDTVRGLTVLLVDDVHTTGATLYACTQALKNAGARGCACLTVTYAPQD